MTNGDVQQANPADPTKNVKDIVSESVGRVDDLREAETKRVDEKIGALDNKNQIQFASSEKAVNTAFVAQEKAIAAALAGTKEAINKSDATTDKRFDLLSEKIDGVVETISKNLGQSGLYVTQVDLNNGLSKLQDSFETMLRPVITFMDNQRGKQGAEDPAMLQLLSEVKSLRDSRSSGEGKSAGLNIGWIYLIGGVGLVSTILGIVMLIITISRLGG